MKEFPRIGVAVIVGNDAVLLGKRKNSHCASVWGFPGGHLEHGETMEECAARELLEETGLKATQLEVGPWTSDILEGKHYITFFVYARQFEGTVELMEPHKCEGWQWFSWQDLPNPLFQPIVSLLQKL